MKFAILALLGVASAVKVRSSAHAHSKVVSAVRSYIRQDEPSAADVIAFMDTDGSGGVSETEFRAFAKQHMPDMPQEILECLIGHAAGFDANGNGEIDATEL